jgi:organic hydroperoxide reductase OsmC/OhrA
MSVTAKRFEYRTALDPDGSLTADGDARLVPQEAWTPEHLLLAGLARCVLTSLRHYARGAEVSGGADAWCLVTLREDDGRFAILEARVDLDVTVEPAPEPDRLPRLLELAEGGCFVGNSLRVEPRYAWTVNGRPASP